MDTFEAVADERRSAADLIETLSQEQLAQPSLCEGWTVHDVAAHLTAAWDGGIRGYAVAALRTRGNLNRANDMVARKLARRPIGEIATSLREHAGNRRTRPGLGPEAPLADVVIHVQDICRPLGIDRDLATDRARVVLDFLVALRAKKRRIPVAPKSLDGLRLIATDQDWASGEGDEVRGASVDLVLALGGRPEPLDHLEGSGVEELRRRVASEV